MYRRIISFTAYVSMLLLAGCSGTSVAYLRARASHLVSAPTSQPAVALLTATPVPVKLVTMVGQTSSPIIGSTKLTQAATSNEQLVTGKVTVDAGTKSVPLRAGPGTSFGQLGRLFPGQTVEVTGRSPQGEWWRVKLGELEGWIYAGFLAVEHPMAVPCIGVNNNDCTSK